MVSGHMTQVISQKKLNKGKKLLCWVTLLVGSNSE